MSPDLPARGRHPETPGERQQTPGDVVYPDRATGRAAGPQAPAYYQDRGASGRPEGLRGCQEGTSVSTLDFSDLKHL